MVLGVFSYLQTQGVWKPRLNNFQKKNLPESQSESLTPYTSTVGLRILTGPFSSHTGYGACPKFNWAFKKSGCLGYRGWYYPVMGIMIRQYKDPYKPISVMESKAGFFSWLNYKTLKKKTWWVEVSQSRKGFFWCLLAVWYANFRCAWMFYEVSKWFA